MTCICHIVMCNEMTARPLVPDETHTIAVRYAKKHGLKVWKVYEQGIAKFCNEEVIKNEGSAI